MQMYSPTVPVRIRRDSLKRLRRIKARRMLAEERLVSDADVIDEALKKADRLEIKAKKKTVNLLDFAGFIKGGPRTNSAVDADEVVYERDD